MHNLAGLSLVLICLLRATPAQADGGLLEFIASQTSAALGTSVELLPRRALPTLSIPDGAELALGLNKMQPRPADIVAIFEAIAAAGALQGELEII